MLRTLLAGLVVFLSQCTAAEPLVFLVTSDSHYEAVQNLDRNDRNHATIQRMNAIAGVKWPEPVGGGAIGKPRGVLVLGDLIDDGDRKNETAVQWRHFEKHFGLDGTDGLLKYPVYEGWGNHDGPPIGKEKNGFSVQAQIKDRNATRKAAGRISHLSPNGLHYSWDWDQVHFIQANLYPADRQHPRIKYSLPWHDPQNALEFVREDLKANVGTSGRPVVVMSHCGFDTDWWHEEDWNAFAEVLKPYNVIAYFYGHTGTGLKKWKAPSGSPALDLINTGQTEKGFFVVEISDSKLRLAYQVKKDPKAETPEWDWKYPLSKGITRP